VSYELARFIQVYLSHRKRVIQNSSLCAVDNSCKFKPLYYLCLASPSSTMQTRPFASPAQFYYTRINVYIRKAESHSILLLTDADCKLSVRISYSIAAFRFCRGNMLICEAVS
jgi:hypothetical protein